MEFTNTQIASLVLGYLKKEKCFGAVKYFVRNSEYFKKYRTGNLYKYIPTRMFGLTLIDFLNEYAEIYTLIHERLEASNYFEKTVNSRYMHCSLKELLSHLLDQDAILGRSSSTLAGYDASSSGSEVDTTPSNTLPGNSCSDNNSTKDVDKQPNTLIETENLSELNISQLITQTFLKNPELSQKIAETINDVRNASNENVEQNNKAPSFDANNEIEEIIKTVVQRTENGLTYQKMVEDLMSNSMATPNTDTQNYTQAPPSNLPNVSEQNPGDVYVFDGNLEAYLKTSSSTSDQFCIRSDGVVMMPSAITAQSNETSPKQYYLVSSSNISENDIMMMPTVIVKDGDSNTHGQSFTPLLKIASRKSSTTKSTTSNGECLRINISTPINRETVGKKTTPKTQSHVRSLNFSTPLQTDTSTFKEIKIQTTKKKLNTWDADIRTLLGSNETNPTYLSRTENKPTIRKSAKKINKKSKKSSNCTNKASETGAENNAVPTIALKIGSNNQEITENRTVEMGKNVEQPKNDEQPAVSSPSNIRNEKQISEENSNKPAMNDVLTLSTPTKMGILNTSNMHCTPFAQVIEQQLEGVDITTLSTPNFPITPNISESIERALRKSDYSTSSSYYQPSDSEQNKEIQLSLEEVEKQTKKIPEISSTNNACKEHLETFKKNTIVRKDMKLLKRYTLNSIEHDKEKTLTKPFTSFQNRMDRIKHNEPSKIESEPKKFEINNILKESLLKGSRQIISIETPEQKAIKNELETKRARTLDIIKSELSSGTKTDTKLKSAGVKTIRKCKMPTIKLVEKKKTTLNKKDTEYMVVESNKQDNPVITKQDTEKISENASNAEEIDTDEAVIFDKKSLTCEDLQLVHDETRSVVGKRKDCAEIKQSERSFAAKVFVDRINTEVMRKFTCTKVQILLNISPKNKRTYVKTKRAISTSKKMKNKTEYSPKELEHTDTQTYENELMDYALIGSVREENSPEVDSTKNKRRLSTETESAQPDDTKRFKGHQLLKNVNVDAFLDKLHGEY